MARNIALLPRLKEGPNSTEVVRVTSTARDILTRPTQSATRRALIPGEHIPIVRPLGAAEVTLHSLPSLFYFLKSAGKWHMGGIARWGSTARVERAPSERARSASKETLWLSPHL
jgi:hypothetical protein